MPEPGAGQNIYDNADFFAGYSQLARSREGLAGAPEWPALRTLLPPLAGAEVLDLGCGFGWFARWARTHGAVRVHAVDISENMLTRARAMTDDPAISYTQADLEHFRPAPASADLVFSALALHYIVALAPLLAAIHAALRPGGHFVFSTEHPIYTAPTRPGWQKGEGQNGIWPIDNYCVEGPRETNWLAPGVIKQHRMLATTIAALHSAGFTLRHLVEWAPTPAQIAAQPALAAELNRPMFALFAAIRGG